MQFGSVVRILKAFQNLKIPSSQFFYNILSALAFCIVKLHTPKKNSVCSFPYMFLTTYSFILNGDDKNKSK